MPPRKAMSWPAGVVAADSCLGGAPDVERGRVLVRVRAGRRVDDGVGAVDELELRVPPVRTLRALVGAVPDLERCPVERLPRRARGEVELDHLPVALVEV